MKNQLSIVAIFSLVIVCLGCSVFAPEKVKQGDKKSPTEAYRAFIMSIQTTDTDLMKRNMSKGTIKMMEKTAKQRKVSLDELLLAIRVQKKYEPKLRNEKINGDIATVEEENDAYGGWDTVYLVHEDGSWKFAADKTTEARGNQLMDK